MLSGAARNDSPLPLIHCSLVGMGVVLLTFLVFSPVLRNDFLAYDDDVYVYNNPRVQTFSPDHIVWFFTHPYYRSYIPLTMTSHAVDYALWQDDPRGHHLTSLLLHSINAGWVFLLGLIAFRLGKNEGEGLSRAVVFGSASAALLFALHPLRAEPVAWISDRKDLLCAFFLIPSCISYFRYARQRESGRRWYFASLVLFALALLSKSVALMTPAVLFLADVLLCEPRSWRSHWRARVREKFPFVVLSIAAGILAMVAAPAEHVAWMIEHLSPGLTLVFPFYATLFYLLKTVLPFSLTPMYPRVGVEVLLTSLAAFLVVAVACVAAARRGKQGLLFAASAYVLFLLPTLVGASSGIQPIADRYSYLAMISLFLLCGAGIATLTSGRMQAALAATAVVLVALGVLSFQQVSRWRNAESLWGYVVAVHPDIPYAHNNLGTALSSRGDKDGAIACFQTALGLKPDYPEPWYNLGIVYEAKGNAGIAEEMYLKAIGAKRDYSDALVNLGNLYVRTGRVDSALTAYARAVHADPEDADAYYNMGIAYYTRGDRDQALVLFRKATQLNPAYANAYFNIGVILVQEGNAGGAITPMREAARLGHVQARRFLEAKGETW